MKKLKTSFITIPMHVLEDKGISSSEKLLLGVLISYSQKYGYAFPFNDHLGKLLGCSVTTVSTGIARLRAAGYIKIESPGGFRRKIRVEKWVIEGPEIDNYYQELKQLYENHEGD